MGNRKKLETKGKKIAKSLSHKTIFWEGALGRNEKKSAKSC
jgi:hypothetical protein